MLQEHDDFYAPLPRQRFPIDAISHTLAAFSQRGETEYMILQMALTRYPEQGTRAQDDQRQERHCQTFDGE
jgi:hypothetical protein